MITWISKGPVTALALFILTGCDAGQGIGPALRAAGGETKSPLSRANMVNGVTLVAPRGYCIDRTSLEPRFAVMARCDGLGVAQAAGAAPRGLITVSLTNNEPGALPSAPLVARASKLQNLEAVEQSDDRVIFRADGRIPIGGLDPTQWRGVARIGQQTAGIAVYGAENGEIVTKAGRDVLMQLIDRSIDATPVRGEQSATVAARN